MSVDASKPWDHLTSLEHLVELAGAVFARTGGGSSFNARELACVEGKLGSAWTAELYVDDSDKVEGFVFAAHLMFALIRGHCLVDGNKRVAWIALIDTLARLGWSVESSDDDAVDFCLGLCVRADASAAEVREWLAQPGRLVRASVAIG
jgi:death on curing protein